MAIIGDCQKLAFCGTTDLACHSTIKMKYSRLTKEILKIRMNPQINNLYYPMAVLYTVSVTARMTKRDKLQR